MNIRTPKQVPKQRVVLPLGSGHPILQVLSNVVPPLIPGGKQAFTRLATAGKESLCLLQFLGVTLMFTCGLVTVLESMMLAEITQLVEYVMAIWALKGFLARLVKAAHVLSPVRWFPE